MGEYEVGRRGKKKKKKRTLPPSKFANAYYDVTSPAAFTGSARRLAKEVEGRQSVKRGSGYVVKTRTRCTSRQDSGSPMSPSTWRVWTTSGRPIC